MARADVLNQVEPPPISDDRGTETGLALVIERLALNPSVDVEKLEKIIALQERILGHQAKAAFHASFARMQPELPEITERGQILVKGTLRSTYAKLEDIQAAIKPVLKQFEFAIRHRTEWPVDKPGILRIVGILSHAQGHSEESVFEAPADKSDYRTDIQSMGSTVSYGRRYTTLDLLNITTRGLDDDGGRPKSKEPAAPEPDGYDIWLNDLETVADQGWSAFSKAWSESKIQWRNHLMATNKMQWLQLKHKAEGKFKS